MKVIVSEAAADDLDGILDWISRDSPRPAAELVRRILARIDRLAIPGHSQMGRPGLVEGTREVQGIANLNSTLAFFCSKSA